MSQIVFLAVATIFWKCSIFDYLNYNIGFLGFLLLLLSIQQVHVLSKTSLTDIKDENTKQSEAKRSKC